jgi:hypothetical protein
MMSEEQRAELDRRKQEAAILRRKHFDSIVNILASTSGMPRKFVQAFLVGQTKEYVDSLCRLREAHLVDIENEWDEITIKKIHNAKADYLEKRNEMNTKVSHDFDMEKVKKFGKSLSVIPGAKKIVDKAIADAPQSTGVQSASLLFQLRINAIFSEMMEDLDWVEKEKEAS